MVENHAIDTRDSAWTMQGAMDGWTVDTQSLGFCLPVMSLASADPGPSTAA